MADKKHNKNDTIIHVLLVDDQPIIAEGIRRMLEAEKDIEFYFCEDPSKAIDTAIDVDATVILQDLIMPEVDGMTLVRFYRANHSTKDIPGHCSILQRRSKNQKRCIQLWCQRLPG